MSCIDNYKDLCIDIETQQCIVEDIEKELKQLGKLIHGPKDITGIDYSRGPSGSTIQIPLDRIIDRAQRITKRLNVEQEILQSKIETKKKIEEKLKELKGLDAKVVHMRDIQGKELKDIAEVLGYSYQYVKEISARNKPTFNILTTEN
ncbi:hypothetical protein [Anaerophilus nitritogenes]|uniref:hypothetical protein n=1 Tax=Anaerophilus nitritogenes TaxID=2498136 RepID=UPI00101D4C96|nr:hypothetical protein [Anaerophilus nitritogenes]